MYLAKLLVECIPEVAVEAGRIMEWLREVAGIIAKQNRGMMWIINRLHAEGIRHFAMVHDSYGVHACDVDLLNRILREEFVRIYSEPVLQNFLDQQRKVHPGSRCRIRPQPETSIFSRSSRLPTFLPDRQGRSRRESILTTHAKARVRHARGQ